MASLIVRILVNVLIGGLMFIFGFIFISTLLLLVYNILSLFFLILFFPIWIIILVFERELIWTLIFLLKKAPYHNLSKTSGRHEKILEDYLKTHKLEKKDL